MLWDLSVADIDGDGMVTLDMSGIPGEHELIQLNGQVQDGAGAGLPATVQFFSPSLAGSMGLVATYQRSVTTDAAGRYEAKLFPGQYRVVAIPDARLASVTPDNSSAGAEWGITEVSWDVGKDALQGSECQLFPEATPGGDGERCARRAGQRGDPGGRAVAHSRHRHGLARGTRADAGAPAERQQLTRRDRNFRHVARSGDVRHLAPRAVGLELRLVGRAGELDSP